MAKKRTEKPFTKKQVAAKLADISGWDPNESHTEMSKSFPMPSFVTGLAFVAKIAVHAEVAGHHPDIELSYNTVRVKLTTHDASGLTKKDFELAKKIDNLKQSF